MSSSKKSGSRSETKDFSSSDKTAVPIVDVIKALLDPLPPELRAAVLKEINEYLNPIPVQRAGEVLEIISQLFATKQDWSVDEIRSKFKEIGYSATPKEIYNAVGYLNRRGHVRRIGYGKYVIGGVVFETSDDFGGPELRHDDEYRTGREQANVDQKGETPKSENDKNG